MKFEDQCVNLELSKRLKELGVKQESLVAWAEYPHLMQQQEDGTSKCIETITEIRGTYYWREDEINSWSAFTASELLEILPNNINGNTLRIIKDWMNEYCVAYPDLLIKIESISRHDRNLCHALAKLLIHLIENKIIEV